MNNREMKIGLDRIKLSNVVIPTFSKSKFEALGGKISLGEGMEIINVDNGEVLQVDDLSVNIEGFALGTKDNYCMQLQIFKKGGRDNWKYSLGVNVPKLFHATNVNNIHTVSEVEKIPLAIVKHMQKCGVEIDLSNATVISVEVNYNIHDDKFINTFKLINEMWKHNNNKVFIVDTKNGFESLKLKLSEKKSIKIYNKAKHLKDTLQFVIKDDVARVEVLITDKTGIKSIVKTNNLEGLCCNLERIQEFYKRTINTNIKIPYEKYVNDRMNEIIKMLNEGEKMGEIFGHLCYIGKVVDIEIFEKAIKQYYKQCGKRIPYTAIKRHVNKIDSEVRESLSGNDKRMKAFFEQIGL